MLEVANGCKKEGILGRHTSGGKKETSCSEDVVPFEMNSAQFHTVYPWAAQVTTAQVS